MMRQLMHTEERGGFTIHAYRHDEDMSPLGQFQLEDGSDDLQIVLDIERGHYDWFGAEVTASKAGIELASDSLWGCCYDSFAQFVETEGYYGDMVLTVIAEAHNKLAELCAA